MVTRNEDRQVVCMENFKGGEGRFGAGFAHRRGDVVEKLIGGLVDDRNAAAVDVEDDIKAV